MRRYRIRLFAGLIIQPLSSTNTDIYLRCHQWLRFHEISEAFPYIAFALAPAVQPVEQEFPYVKVKLLQTGIIVCNAIVMVISDEHFIQLPDEHICRDMTVFPYISPHFLALLLGFLPAGFPLYPELTTLVCGSVMCKTQKVKCCSFGSLFRCILLGEPPKLD